MVLSIASKELSWNVYSRDAVKLPLIWRFVPRERPGLQKQALTEVAQGGRT